MLSTTSHIGICPRISSEFSRLAQATTWRDILSVPSPVKIADLQNPVNFASFRPKGSFKLLVQSGGIQTDDKDIEWIDRLHNFESNEEVMSLVHAFEQTHFPAPARYWKVDCRRQLNNHSNYRQAAHTDRPDKPRGRLYLCANGNHTTHVVSHSDTIDIFDTEMPGYLDNLAPAVYSISRSLEFQKNIDALRHQFEEIATPMDSNALYVMTGATVHFKPEGTRPDRVLFRAFVH